MAADFNVRFLINRKTGVYQLQLIDDSDFVIDTLKGLFKVTYPNGTVQQNTDNDNPDTVTEGDSANYPLYFNNDNAVLRGTYTVLYTVINDGDIDFIQKEFSFDWIEPDVTIEDDSDTAIPEVVFTDATDYDHGSFTEVTDNYSFSADFPSTSELDPQTETSGTTELDMVNGGDYYEGVYAPTVDVEMTFTSTTYAYLTVKWYQETSESFSVYKVPTHTQLFNYVITFKDDQDTYKGTNSHQFETLDEEFDNVVSLYFYFIERVLFNNLDGSNDALNELLTRLNISREGYSFQATPIEAFQLQYAEFTAIQGSGTTGFIPRFTASGTIGDSLIQQIGNNLLLGGGIRVNTHEEPSTPYNIDFVEGGDVIGFYSYTGGAQGNWSIDDGVNGLSIYISAAGAGDLYVTGSDILNNNPFRIRAGTTYKATWISALSKWIFK